MTNTALFCSYGKDNRHCARRTKAFLSSWLLPWAMWKAVFSSCHVGQHPTEGIFKKVLPAIHRIWLPAENTNGLRWAGAHRDRLFWLSNPSITLVLMGVRRLYVTVPFLKVGRTVLKVRKIKRWNSTRAWGHSFHSRGRTGLRVAQSPWIQVGWFSQWLWWELG